MTALSQFRVLSFDCYGTLIDWERGLCDAFRPSLAKSNRSIGDEQLLETYAQVETVIQTERPGAKYPDVLREAHHRVMDRLELPRDEVQASQFGDSIGDWPAFPDSPEALRRLKERFKLVILSNIDRASFELSRRRLGIDFDAIITAEDVGSYKPAMGHFDRCAELIQKWGIKKSQWLHVAQSLFHDHVPAKSLGLSTAWINRREGKIGSGATPVASLQTPPDWETPTLAALADLVDASFDR